MKELKTKKAAGSLIFIKDLSCLFIFKLAFQINLQHSLPELTMADPTGFEPVTSRSVVWRSNPTELRVHMAAN